MKTVEETTATIVERIMPAIDAYCRIYGAQVREEAAKIASKEIGSTRHQIAAAIRKMKLP